MALLLLEAGLGTGITKLLEVVIAFAKKTSEFKSNLETLKNSLQSVECILNDVEKLNRVLNRPEEETHRFIEQLSRGVNLVEKCATIPFLKKNSYSKKLTELDESISMFFSRVIQGSVVVNTLRNGVGIQEINEKIDFMFKWLNISSEPTDSASFGVSLGEFSSQSLPLRNVGLDKLLHNLKEPVLQDRKEPVDVVSNPGGHDQVTLVSRGKATSAVMHRDYEIRILLQDSISELFELCRVTPNVTKRFKHKFKALEWKLKSVTPLFRQPKILNLLLNRPEEETYQFINEVTRGVILINLVCTVKSWNVYKSYVYQKKLGAFEIAISKFFHIEVQGSHVPHSLSNVRTVSNGELDLKPKPSDSKYQYAREGVNGALSSGFSGRVSSMGYSNEVAAAGFSKHLKDLKEMLLLDKEPITVLSAPRGCGKTILARKLCRDPEIQRIFGKNILFLNVSELANIAAIVHNILNCLLRGSLVPDFQNDDDAIKYLECFQKAIGPRPILLVLDDVCRDVQSLIDKLALALPNYKILVITRLCFLEFSHVYNLKSQNDQHSMSLSCQSALPKYGSSEILDDLVEEVVWRREEKKSSGKSPHMHIRGESSNIADLKNMDSHINLVELSHKNLPDLSCTSGKQAGKKMKEASQIRKNLPGVVIRELSSEVILSHASQGEATSTGGKGKEKVVYA